jgi:hypothetical protein
MVITRTEFDKAMKEINEFAVAVNARLEALEKPAVEAEEKKVVAKVNKA